VLVLGHGEMGRAMEYLLHARHALTIWERRPQPGAPPVELESATAQQDVILFCLPANPHFELASRLRACLRPDTVCVSVAKGLDDQGRTAARALTQALGPEAPIAVLYGPMISEEIRAGRPAFAQAGVARAESFVRLRELFAGTPLHLEHSCDIEGISWSAVLKNVYAILFGVADELGLGDNMRGYLATAAMHELERIVAGLGASAGAAHGLAGLGDLITTATSKGSHHHELGRRLVRGETAALEGEGVHTLKMVRAHRLFDPRHHPLFDLIGRLLDQPEAARALMKIFLEGLDRA
jgi:glycerol-3-phosphate dehydrogenase (NAD(P)+)